MLPDPGAADRLLTTVTLNSAAFSNPSGDAVFTPGSLTGNAAGSAIGTGVIHPNRIVPGSFDAATVASVFAAGSIAEAILATAVQDKLIFAGLIGMVRTAAEKPSGWTVESNLAGRIPVGAGTTHSVTFTEDTAYGTSWAHDHTMNAHTHPVAGTTDTTPATPVLPKNGDNDWPTSSTSHTHPYSGTSAGSSASSSSVSWQIPVKAYLYVRRDA